MDIWTGGGGEGCEGFDLQIKIFQTKHLFILFFYFLFQNLIFWRLKPSHPAIVNVVFFIYSVKLFSLSVLFGSIFNLFYLLYI